MKFALFQPPLASPRHSPRQSFRWAVDQGITAEQLGLAEFWVGEHMTADWVSIPNPEIVLGSVALETERIVLGPATHVPSYWSPAKLAAQTAWLSQIANGRYVLGVATGVNPVDSLMNGILDRSETFPRMVEALEIMELFWAAEPYDFEGKYWNSTFGETFNRKLRDWRPFGGRMPVAVAGTNMDSPSIRYAGANGYLPLSFGAKPELVANHYATFAAAAAEAGRTEIPGRDQHRVGMNVFVAETDAEAERIAVDGPIAEAWRGQMIPNEQNRAKQAGVLPWWDENTSMTDIVRGHMVVGSPETVIEKLNEKLELSGGWGTTLVLGYDFLDDPAPWNQSLELLVKEVAPKLRVPVHA